MRKFKIFFIAFAVLFLMVGAVNAYELDATTDNINDNLHDLNSGEAILSSQRNVLSSEEIALSSNDNVPSEEIASSSNDNVPSEEIASSSNDNVPSEEIASSSNDDVFSDDSIKSSNANVKCSLGNSQVSETENDFNGTSFSQLKSAINICGKNDILILNNDISQEGSSSITIQNSLTIDGNGHTIDAQGKSGIFKINYANVTLMNIIFKNARSGNFGAIEIYDSNCSLINCSFENNQGYYDGAAISLLSGSLNLSDCTFKNNKAINKNGGAVYSLSDVYMHNCTFINNSASYGGAIYSLKCYLVDCTFKNNSADLGGAIYSKGTALTIEFSQFLDNSASNNGGALFLNSVIDSKISFSSFFRNNASLEGGAFYCNNSISSIDGSLFINNTALKAGGIYYLNSTNSMDNCYFNYNLAHEDGGAMILNDSQSDIINSNFEFNVAGKKGAAIYWTPEDKELQCNISQSSFLNNKAESYSLTSNFTEGILNFMLIGWSNYVNAIYAESAINLSDVEYWNGYMGNTDYEIYNNGASGQDIILEIYDSRKVLVSNVTLMTNSYGQQYFTTSYLDDGFYTYKAYHLDNSYYTYVESEGNFTLNRPASSISLSIDDNAEFNYFDCTIPFDISNRTAVNVLITNENGSYVYLNASVGANDRSISVYFDSSDEYYNITVFNIPNNFYEGSQDSKLFKILASNSSISINPIGDVVYGNIINVTYDVENETIVIATLYDKDENKILSLMPYDGKFSLPILPVGQYNLILENIETPNIRRSNDYFTFNVLKTDNYAIISANDVVYGDATTIVIYAQINGDYTLDINGSLIDVEVDRGMGSLDLTLPAGDYSIKGIFNNSNCNNFITNATCTVSKANNTAFIRVDDSFDGYETEIKIYSPTNGVYLLDVNGTLINVSVYNGVGKASLLLPVGSYYAKASFNNPNYNTDISNATFNVYDLVYSGSANNINSAGTIEYGIPFSDNVINSDNGKSLSDGTASVDGTRSINGNCSTSGNVSGSANGDGTSFGNATSSTNSSNTVGSFSRFAGNKNINMYYNNGTKYTVKVYGDDGELVGADELVTINLNKKKYNVKTDSKGVASLLIPNTVKPGNYTITATYKGQTIKNTIKVISRIKANKNVNMYYFDGSKYSLKVYGKTGKLLANQTVKIKINKKTYAVKSNKNGVVSFKIPNTVKPGTYTISATYAGLTVNNKVKVKQVLSSQKTKTVKRLKGFTLTATLKNGKKALKGKVISFKFNGKTYKAKTNKNGIAKVTINKKAAKKLKRGKTYKLIITFYKVSLNAKVKAI